MIIPMGLLWKIEGKTQAPDLFAHDTKRVELLAMKTIMEYERELGFIPRDVSTDKVGLMLSQLFRGLGISGLLR